MSDNLKNLQQKVEDEIDPNGAAGSILAQNHQDILKEVLEKAGKYTGTYFVAHKVITNFVSGTMSWEGNAMNNVSPFVIKTSKLSSDLNDFEEVLSRIGVDSLLSFKDYVGRRVLLLFQSYVANTDGFANDIYDITVKGVAGNINYTYQDAEFEIAGFEVVSAVAPTSGLFNANTFINGVSGTITTKSLLAAKLNGTDGFTLNDSHINNFTINGSDIECHIDTNYHVKLNAFENDLTLTSFLDKDGQCLIINNQGFRGCTNLINIELPNVENIGGFSFENCDITGVLSLPKCRTMGATCFSSNTNITQISIPLLRELEISTFLSCAGLTTISENDLFGLLSINAEAFSGVPLTSVNLPSVEELKGNAFRLNGSLITFLAPKLRRLQHDTFRNSNLTTLDFPELISIDVANPTTGLNFSGVPLTSLNIPKCVKFGDDPSLSEGIFTNIGLNCVINVHPAMRTIDSGDLEGDLKFARDSRSATITFEHDKLSQFEIDKMDLSNLGSYADDTAAGVGGVAIGEGYINSSTGALHRRLT